MTQQSHPFADGPFLTAALMCERLLTEEGGVHSLIRVVDRVTQTASGPEPPEEMTAFNHQMTLFVAFKSGSARGPMELTIRVQKPSGVSSPAIRRTLNFEGDDDRGINAITVLNMKIDIAGTWWIHVMLDGVEVSRVPLRVIYERRPTPEPTGAE